MKTARPGTLALALLAGAVCLYADDQKPSSLLQDAATGKVKPAKVKLPDGTERRAPFFSTGTLEAAKHALDTSVSELRLEESDFSSGAILGNPDIGIGKGTLGCSERGNDDQHGTRVNQDCTFRRQAEEKIVFNPANPDNLLAGQNDSRVGFNQCGIDFSKDNGLHWGDLLPPFRQKVNFPAGQTPIARDPNSHTIVGGPGTFHTYDAGSDPAPAFDSRGRGFFSCVAFDVFSNASMVYVTESPLDANGSFFFNLDTFGRQFVVVEDNSAKAVHDKEFVVADTFPSSRNRDNVYVTWTILKFSPDCGPQPNPSGVDQFCSATIFGSMSTDHAHTWSTPEAISGNSTTLCFFGNFFDPTANPHACNLDQGSDPIVRPNGDLFVAFNNGNTAANNPNAQQLGVRCSPSGSSPSGTAHLNCGAPVKVGDDIVVGEPLCDFGRGPEECIPGAFIRTNDFPRIAINRSNGDLYTTWQDYRNGEFDIQLARSTDGGLTWSASVTLNPDRGLDHYFPAIDLAANAAKDRVGDSYFRTERVPRENGGGVFAPGQPGVQRGNSDYVLAGGTALAAPYDFKVLSPVFPPPDGEQAGFNGDYTGLTINKGEEAHPIWSDTRNADPFSPNNGVVRDEDVFTLATPLPDGTRSPTVGRIGRN